MEKIAFQLAWLGEHKVLIFLFFCRIAGRGVPADRFSSSASVLAEVKF